MRTATAGFIAEKNKQANKPLFLYKVYAYDGTNHLYYAEAPTDITFDSQVYVAFPVTHDFISESSSGQISQVRLKCSNVSRAIQAYLEAYDLRGKRVDIIMVWADKLDEPTNKLVDTYYIDNYSSNERDAEFTLTSKLDVIDLLLPSGKYLRTHCRWAFKSTECAYSGAETECDRTFQRCKVLANQVRFGGFPSIPFRNVYVAG
jgi:lambda family phage minor tail protein L